MGYWIVVVDDDVTNLKMARSLLNDHDMRVSVVRSGKDFLIFMQNNEPDLVLLDIMMPEMDGFEVYERLRKYEEETGRTKTPVIFLTADNDSESEKRGFELGASDFIRKPFNKDVLLHRIENIVSSREKIKDLTEEAMIDQLTGFLNKNSLIKKMEDICQKETGAFLIIDLDSFKLVNDIYGHEMGDKVLQAFADVVRNNMRSEDVIGRIGGDEFVAFCRKVLDESIIKKMTERLNEQITMEAKKLMGENFNIPLGVSVGMSFITKENKDYQEVFRQADKALYYVKQNGKHGYAVFGSKGNQLAGQDYETGDDIAQLDKILEERNEASTALWIGQEMFIQIYRFMLRYIKRYSGVAYKILFTLHPKDKEYAGSNMNEIIEEFGEMLKQTLRKSDMLMQSRPNQFFILLPELHEEHVECVVQRILQIWEDSVHAKDVEVVYEAKQVE